MGDLYGAITAGTVSAVVTLFIQVLKSHFGIDGKRSFILSFIFAFFLATSFHLIMSLIDFRNAGYMYDWLDLAKLALEAVIYSILTWATSLGLYKGIVSVKNGEY